MKVIRPREVPSGRRAAEQFTGTAFGDLIHEPAPGEPGVRVNLVLFEPGSRTFWHRHRQGQAIYVTAGRGWIRTEGTPRETIGAGDVVIVDPGEWHWHGATRDNFVLHLTVNPGNEASTEWRGMEVSDDEYLAGAAGDESR